MSCTEPWWFDTLVEFARRWRRPVGSAAMAQPPGAFINWCIGVEAKEIERPKRRGRPPNYMRDRLICTAVKAYADPARGDKAVPHTRACWLVADAAGLNESVVARIWRRSRQGQQ